MAETRIPGARDHVTLPVTHAGLLTAQAVADEVVSFLRHGAFGAV